MAFQCRKLWNFILKSLGFSSFLANVARCFWKRRLLFLRCIPKTSLVSFLASSLRNREMSFFYSLNILELLPLSGATIIVLFVKSMSVH